jgi:Fe-S-cluster-containing hydrogenase component 2
MKKLQVHSNKCTGCRSCMLICSFMHTDACSYHESRIKITSDEARGRHTPVLCQFCEDPPCVAACPVEALSRDAKTSAIHVDVGLCNGCQACISACPFEAMFFDQKNQIAITCDLCGGNPECVKVCQLPEALVYS